MAFQQFPTWPRTAADSEDPYRYQVGFGNHHSTEAIPGALPPHGTNLPQKSRYGLYAELLNGTSFMSTKSTAANVYVGPRQPLPFRALTFLFTDGCTVESQQQPVTRHHRWKRFSMFVVEASQRFSYQADQVDSWSHAFYPRTRMSPSRRFHIRGVL